MNANDIRVKMPSEMSITNMSWDDLPVGHFLGDVMCGRTKNYSIYDA